MGNAKRDNTWPSVMWLAKRDFGDKYLWKCEISEVVINQLNLKKKKNRSLSHKLKWRRLKYLELEEVKAWRHHGAN